MSVCVCPHPVSECVRLCVRFGREAHPVDGAELLHTAKQAAGLVKQAPPPEVSTGPPPPLPAPSAPFVVLSGPPQQFPIPKILPTEVSRAVPTTVGPPGLPAAVRGPPAALRQYPTPIGPPVAASAASRQYTNPIGPAAPIGPPAVPIGPLRPPPGISQPPMRGGVSKTCD